MTINILTCVYGKCVIPQRYILCFLTFFGIAMAYSVRVCLHITITEMVLPVISNKRSTPYGEVCVGDNRDTTPAGGKLNWTEKQQGIVLAAFFPGYMVTHLPGGIVADKYGGKHIFSAGIAISGVLTVLTPVTIDYGDWWALAIIRCIIGIAQGPLFPSMTSILARWVPPRERSTLLTIVTTGCLVGTITGNLGSSYLIAYSGVWVIVFYFWGVVCLIWYLFFLLLCYSEPAQHPFITAEEALMLEEEVGKQERFKIPWKKILSDPPIWALISAEVGHDWLFFFVVVELPKYMAEVIKVNIQENGAVNAIPYAALTICCFICGIIADVIINKNIMTVVNTRKLFTAIGKIGPGICVVLMSYMGCNVIAVGTMFVLCMVIMAPFFAGLRVNTLDITKSFAGIVMGIVNGIGAVAFVPIPYIVALVTSHYALEEWRAVFWGLFITSVVTTVSYVIWASAERAEWDKNPLQA